MRIRNTLILAAMALVTSVPIYGAEEAEHVAAILKIATQSR